MPGGRLKLDPRDLYAFGAHRGGIDERWFSSTTKAANGPLTNEDEGLSYIEFGGKKVLLKEAIETACDYDVEYRFKRAADGVYRWHIGRAEN